MEWSRPSLNFGTWAASHCNKIADARGAILPTPREWWRRTAAHCWKSRIARPLFHADLLARFGWPWPWLSRGCRSGRARCFGIGDAETALAAVAVAATGLVVAATGLVPQLQGQCSSPQAARLCCPAAWKNKALRASQLLGRPPIKLFSYLLCPFCDSCLRFPKLKCHMSTIFRHIPLQPSATWSWVLVFPVCMRVSWRWKCLTRLGDVCVMAVAIGHANLCKACSFDCIVTCCVRLKLKLLICRVRSFQPTYCLDILKTFQGCQMSERPHFNAHENVKHCFKQIWGHVQTN